MAVQKGDDFILKITDGETPSESFLEISGVQLTSFLLINNEIKNNKIAQNQWLNLFENSVEKQLEISASGIFTDSESEEKLREYSFSGSIKNYELHFGNGKKISGKFLIKKYNRTGNINDYEKFSITLISSGEVVYDSIL